MDRARDPDFARRLFGGRPEHRLALMRAAWPLAVGADIARRTEVAALDRDVLRIKVPDPRWQRTLLRMRGEILSRLRGVAGDAAPWALGFVVGPVPERAEPSSTPSARATTETSPPAPAAVIDAAANIADREMRARFLEVAARYLARFGGDQAAGGGGGPATG
jgi:hypothetical protein